jgi:hypothetical protein
MWQNKGRAQSHDQTFVAAVYDCRIEKPASALIDKPLQGETFGSHRQPLQGEIFFLWPSQFYSGVKKKTD